VRLFFLNLVFLFFHFTGLTGQEIIDKANFLEKDEQKELESILSGYRADFDLDISIVTIKTLGNNDVRDSSRYWFSELNLNDDTLNISALIYVAQQEQKIDLLFGAGLEWLIPEEMTAVIKRSIINGFRNLLCFFCQIFY
jgi:uncharacterized membrane protein YgcG